MTPSICDTCGERKEGHHHVGGDGSWGASYWVCDDCKERYEELKDEERDNKLREALEAERLENRE